MPFTKQLLTTLSLLSTLALAVPNVAVIPATGGCADFPDYDATTGLSAWWDPVLKSSDNSSIEGFGTDEGIVYRQGDAGVTGGRVGVVYRNDEAKLAFRCNSAIPGLIEAWAETGVSGVAWQQINITDTPTDAELGWGLGQYSTPLSTFRHAVNGTVQPGLFLGQDSYTTWAVKYQAENDAAGIPFPYWTLRLLGKDSADPVTGEQLKAGESETFLMVSGSDA